MLYVVEAFQPHNYLPIYAQCPSGAGAALCNIGIPASLRRFCLVEPPAGSILPVGSIRQSLFLLCALYVRHSSSIMFQCRQTAPHIVSAKPYTLTYVAVKK